MDYKQVNWRIIVTNETDLLSFQYLYQIVQGVFSIISSFLGFIYYVYRLQACIRRAQRPCYL